MEKQILVDELEIGVYVARLDRPWTETPFLFQGLMIQSQDDIDKIKAYAKHVYIDVEKGADVDTQCAAPVVAAPPLDFKTVEATTYSNTVPAEQELDAAKQIHNQVKSEVTTLFDGVKEGGELELDRVQDAVTGIVDSVIRNADAFLWLTRLKDKNNSAYTHCLDVCALSVAFARHLGFPKPHLERLGLAAMFFDIGKIRLPDELLQKSEKLTPHEVAVLKAHVNHSVKILKKTAGVPLDVISAVACHHERFDGRGYPNSLEGEEIPLMARLIKITDTYDAMTSERSYAATHSPLQAVRQMYEIRGTHFQESLVEQFIQFIGAYPVGCIVELTTHEVGLVFANNATRRLQPKIILILDGDKKPIHNTPILDLKNNVKDAQGQLITIKRVLEPGTHGIDPNDYYL